jgi:tRNA 2-thiouridine synthesizing protein A
MTIEINARGLSCPQPVILAKKAVDAGKFPIQVIVDTITARENIKRMAENSGCKIQIEEIGDEFKLILKK